MRPCSIAIWPFLALCLLLVLPGCSDHKSGKDTKAGGDGKSKAAPVRVAKSTVRDVPITEEAIGTVEPFASVGVNSQVSGILEKVHFREGEPVKAGALLFTIDSRPFIARLNQAQAALTKDLASLDNARRQADRYLPAAEKGYVSGEQADQAQTSVAALEAMVQAGKAAVENARLDLDNCTIRAPFGGYTGALLVDRGNLVKAAADQPLIKINQMSPIKVSFTLPEQSLAELKAALNSSPDRMPSGAKKQRAAGGMEVHASLADTKWPGLVGTLSFVDNAVDTSTGTIRLKAIFANKNRELWPGQFVTVRLLVRRVKDATVIPSQAVQTGQSGAYVYVLGKEKTVEMRPVALGFSTAEQSVIESGLAPGETVVTDGQLRLKPGAKVKVLEPADKSTKTGAKP